MLKNGRKYRTWQNADDQQLLLIDELIKRIEVLEATVVSLEARIVVLENA